MIIETVFHGNEKASMGALCTLITRIAQVRARSFMGKRTAYEHEHEHEYERERVHLGPHMDAEGCSRERFAQYCHRHARVA